MPWGHLGSWGCAHGGRSFFLSFLRLSMPTIWICLWPCIRRVAAGVSRFAFKSLSYYTDWQPNCCHYDCCMSLWLLYVTMTVVCHYDCCMSQWLERVRSRPTGPFYCANSSMFLTHPFSENASPSAKKKRTGVFFFKFILSFLILFFKFDVWCSQLSEVNYYPIVCSGSVTVASSAVSLSSLALPYIS